VTKLQHAIFPILVEIGTERDQKNDAWLVDTMDRNKWGRDLGRVLQLAMVSFVENTRLVSRQAPYFERYRAELFRLPQKALAKIVNTANQ